MVVAARVQARDSSASVQRVVAPAVQRAAVSRATTRASSDLRFSGVLQRKSTLPISSPSDPAEKEAEFTAQKIMRAPDRSVAAPLAPKPAAGVLRRYSGAPVLARKAVGKATTTTDVAAEISAAGSGAPLPPAVRRFMEARFHAKFDNVRIHTDAQAAKLSAKVSAQAFTVGNQIFFGKGQWQPDSSAGKELLAHELTHTVQQGAAVQRREDVSVTQQSSPQVQRLGMSDVLDFVADKANLIPGYRMFTIVLGVNPVNMSAVDRSAANILRAIVEFLPGGGLITKALDAYGVFDKVGGWIEKQLASLGLSGASIKQALTDFIGTLGLRDLFSPGDVWNRAKRIFSEPVDRIISFVKSLAGAVLTFIKDAILRPLAELASKEPAWDLLCAVMGKNPITGDAVPRNAETLIGGFMKLIGQEEIWENIKKGNAISKAFAWFQNALSGLLGFVRQIPTLFLTAVKSLDIADIVLLPRAFVKVAMVFGGFFGKFLKWAGGTIWDLLEIIVSVVAPGVLVYLKKAQAAFKKILKNPIGFVGNLVKAGKQGLNQFVSKFPAHLKASLIGWLTGALGGAGVYVPTAFTLMEIGKCVLSVLGITWPQIRGKIVKALGPNGEMIMKGLEAGFAVVKAFVTGGIAAVWDLIKQKLTDLRDTVLQSIISFVKGVIVQKAITLLVSMLNPAGAFVQAVIAIYNGVMAFVERMKQIAQVAAAFIDSISAIADGAIGAAANRVEQTMGGLLTLVVSFLARIVGLGGIAAKVVELIKVLQAKVDSALEKGITWIIERAKALFKALFGKTGERTEEEKAKDLDKAVKAVKPKVDALLKKGIQRTKLVPKLQAWATQYKIASMTLEGDDLVARNSPPVKFAKAVAAQASSIRVETHAAAVEVSKLPEIQSAAKDMLQQKKAGAGTPAKPIMVPPQGGLLGAAVAQQQGGLTTTPFEQTTFQIPGATAPITTLQTYSTSPSHTIVNPRSTGNPIGKYADYADHLKARGLSDTDIRVGVALLMAGRPLPAKLAPHESFLAPLTFLLGSTEPARIPSQAAALPQAVRQPTATSGLPQSTPAFPVGAVAANRQADVRAGVAGVTPPSGTPDPAVVQQVIQVQLARTTEFIAAQMEAGGLVLSSNAAVANFIKTELRGLLKEDMIKGFRVRG